MYTCRGEEWSSQNEEAALSELRPDIRPYINVRHGFHRLSSHSVYPYISCLSKCDWFITWQDQGSQRRKILWVRCGTKKTKPKCYNHDYFCTSNSVFHEPVHRISRKTWLEPPPSECISPRYHLVNILSWILVLFLQWWLRIMLYIVTLSLRTIEGNGPHRTWRRSRLLEHETREWQSRTQAQSKPERWAPRISNDHVRKRPISSRFQNRKFWEASEYGDNGCNEWSRFYSRRTNKTYWWSLRLQPFV